MLVQEVLEEIIEKLPDNTLSVPSILRKVTQVRDNLIRQYSGGKFQSEAVTSELDMLTDQPLYPIPAPPSSIVEVEIRNSTDDDDPQWSRLDYKSFDELYTLPYYYLLNGSIGIYPTPTQTIARGIKVFHQPVLSALSVNDLNGTTGFDPNYDMVLVYGVLKDATSGDRAAEFESKYQYWVSQYEAANSGYGSYAINERW